MILIVGDIYLCSCIKPYRHFQTGVREVQFYLAYYTSLQLHLPRKVRNFKFISNLILLLLDPAFVYYGILSWSLISYLFLICFIFCKVILLNIMLLFTYLCCYYIY